MTTPIAQHKAALVACGLVLPGAAVLLSGLMGTGVSQLQAAVVVDETRLPIAPEADLARVVEGWNPDARIASPFWVEPITAGPVANQSQQPTDPTPDNPAPMVRAADSFRVTSVMPSARNPLAVIDGRPRRVGDVLDGGWKIEAINAQDHSVSLVHPSGNRARIGLKNTP